MNVRFVFLLMLVAEGDFANKTGKRPVELNTNDIDENGTVSNTGKTNRNDTVSLQYTKNNANSTTRSIQNTFSDSIIFNANPSSNTRTNEEEIFTIDPSTDQNNSKKEEKDPRFSTIASSINGTALKQDARIKSTTEMTDLIKNAKTEKKFSPKQSTSVTDISDNTLINEEESNLSFELLRSTETQDQINSTTDLDVSSTTESTTSFTEPSTTTETPCPEELAIKNLRVTPSNFSAIVEWDQPEPENCAKSYIVYLNDNEYNTTEKTEIMITNLSACEEYIVNVAVYNGNTVGPNVTEQFNTTFPDPSSYKVRNIRFNDETDLEVTWDPPPDNVVKCVTNYKFTWSDSTGTISENEILSYAETSKKLQIIGCIQYEIDIQPIAGNINGFSTNTNHTVKPLPTRPPTIVDGILKPNKTSIVLTWKTDSNTENMCPLEEIIVTCTPPTVKEEVLNISSESENFTFPMNISDLSPYTNYSCSGVVRNKGGNSPNRTFFFQTLEEVPSAPRDVQVVDVGSSIFKVTWTQPEKINGNMRTYNLIITNNGPLFAADDDCPRSEPIFTNDTPPDQHSYEFKDALPYHNYTIEVYGINGAGNGSRAATEVITKATMPNNVKNVNIAFTYPETEEYSAYAVIEYQSSCTNGPLEHYEIHYKGVRDGFPDDESTFVTQSLNANFTLKPERKYSINITTVVKEDLKSTWSHTQTDTTKPGVPIVYSEALQPPRTNETNRAFFTLQKTAFSNTNGDILYYALILLQKTVTLNESYGFWDGQNWPQFPNDTDIRQITENHWNPFQDGTNVTVFVIKPLKENTKYSLVVRAITSTTFRDSSLINFKTNALDQLDLGLILGLTFGIIAVVVLIAFIVLLLRRRRKGFVNETERRSSVSPPAPIACKKFTDYYNSVLENNNIIKNQYTTIGNLSKELGLSTSYALLPENKRKNRYTNILPYDDTRVKLQIDEDDEIGSDYINASYIKGYSNRIEYIATQGPLESTSKDFWKMIWQENVTIIVMVSQFIEQSKEKCFQYFPNNHEKMSFGESLEIRCSTELHFGTYCVRTLQLRKDIEQRTVYHMQFLEWPDFGVPQGTDNMLEFCHQIREKVVAEGGLIAVHCSAGVGRTGTLIALDILLQTIDNHRDINIYKTVLDLRKQRINMVQTEKQYMFIHTCVKEYLEMSTIQSKEQVEDRVYENVDVLKSSMKKNLIETEVESAL